MTKTAPGEGSRAVGKADLSSPLIPAVSPPVCKMGRTPSYLTQDQWDKITGGRVRGPPQYSMSPLLSSGALEANSHCTRNTFK